MKTKNKKQPKIKATVGQKAEGKKIAFASVKSIAIKELKTFVFESTEQKIEIETKEFSAVCPFSGLPDIARVNIEYYPVTKKALELKALKYYFVSFRNVGIYQEGVTKTIFKDLATVLGHTVLKVSTTYNTRGGIDVVCTESGLNKFEVK